MWIVHKSCKLGHSFSRQNVWDKYLRYYSSDKSKPSMSWLLLIISCCILNCEYFDIRDRFQYIEVKLIIYWRLFLYFTLCYHMYFSFQILISINRFDALFFGTSLELRWFWLMMWLWLHCLRSLPAGHYPYDLQSTTISQYSS